MEEQERHAEHDAQISILKQMLLGPLPKSESPGHAERAARRHRSFHEGDSHEGNYRQMLERFMIETKGADRTSANESENQREVFVFLQIFVKCRFLSSAWLFGSRIF